MGELGCNFEVYRNDELTVDELKRKNPRGILISPGPGTPQDSGISLQTVFELGPIIPLFGQFINVASVAGKVVRSPHGVMHGKSSFVYYNEGGEDGLFTGLSNPFTAGRYHSLVIEKDSFPSEVLEITAWTEDGLVMAARHKIHRHLLLINCGIAVDRLSEGLMGLGGAVSKEWKGNGGVHAVDERIDVGGRIGADRLKISPYTHIENTESERSNGVQFHPESIITTEGRKIVRNFVKLIERLEAETLT
ncbi:hypothetical protein RJ639_026527 [Escallonia herrerae]|uniref:anthranilate synthase n=1 Tax=Escallonia herrerae TaxID=1293975 RepID=A0AA88UYH9_9ASTE|nr:hypothetical protein RJ639_026527 [Escallonia herrerae]